MSENASGWTMEEAEVFLTMAYVAEEGGITFRVLVLDTFVVFSMRGNERGSGAVEYFFMALTTWHVIYGE